MTIRSDEDLREASKIVIYEFNMIGQVTAAIGISMPSSSPDSNALIESFAIHARSLFHFFWDANTKDYIPRKPDDILAIDFLPNRWWRDGSPPPIPDIIKPVKAWTDKRIAHLTYERIAGHVEWPFSEIAIAFNDVIQQFVKEARPEIVDFSELVETPISASSKKAKINSTGDAWIYLDYPVARPLKKTD